VGNGEESGAQAEIAAVTKQTTETLMAGEKIMEALDLADAERAAMKEFEEHKSTLPGADAIVLQPPPRNPILAAYGLEPEEYVLKVVERVQSTALHDALLVLPFGKVVSLMGYLNIWAQNVCLLIKFSVGDSNIGAGMEHNFGFSYHIFSLENAPPPGGG
jgi:U3 small nucleolar RNA-associated protein 12